MNIVIKQEENCELVEMLIDCGAQNSKINKRVWETLGRPELTPTNCTLIAASGATIGLLGQFTANIMFGDKEYKLSLYVANRDDTPNLIGWRWFSILDLNWNTIFSGKDCEISHKPKNKKHNISTSRQQRTTHFYVTLNVEDADFPMMLDTGTSVSLIGMARWEKLGKPIAENKIG